jgi:hypothetical protein
MPSPKAKDGASIPVTILIMLVYQVKKLKHSGRYKVDDLLLVVEMLASDKPLPESYQP